MRIESNTTINKAAIIELKNNRYAALNSKKKKKYIKLKENSDVIKKKIITNDIDRN